MGEDKREKKEESERNGGSKEGKGCRMEGGNKPIGF